MDVRGDCPCFDRALLVVALFTDEHQACQYLACGGASPSHMPSHKARTSQQLPTPTPLPPFGSGCSHRVCCRKHAHKTYDPIGSITSCICPARTKLISDRGLEPEGPNAPMLGALMDALKVGVWVS